MLHFVDRNCKIQFTFVITIPNMPTTRSQKRVINHDDSIVVAKKQKRVPLRRKAQDVTPANYDGIQATKHYIQEEPEEINDNNVSINSDHNDDVAFPSDDEEEFQAHKPILSDDEDFQAHKVVPTQEPANISLEIEEVGGEVEMEFEEILEEETEIVEKRI